MVQVCICYVVDLSHTVATIRGTEHGYCFCGFDMLSGDASAIRGAESKWMRRHCCPKVANLCRVVDDICDGFGCSAWTQCLWVHMQLCVVYVSFLWNVRVVHAHVWIWASPNMLFELLFSLLGIVQTEAIFIIIKHRLRLSLSRGDFHESCVCGDCVVLVNVRSRSVHKCPPAILGVFRTVAVSFVNPSQIAPWPQSDHVHFCCVLCDFQLGPDGCKMTLRHPFCASYFVLWTCAEIKFPSCFCHLCTSDKIDAPLTCLSLDVSLDQSDSMFCVLYVRKLRCNWHSGWFWIDQLY